MAGDDTEQKENITDEEASESLFEYIVEQIRAGVNDTSIIRSLSEMGLSQPDAAEVVESVHADLAVAAEAERATGGSLLVALIAGVGAAILGGVIWGLIIINTGYEIGFMAWGLGLLAGFGVLFVTRGKRGAPYQGIAAISAVLGIVVGKYFTYVHFLKEAVRQQFGDAAASEVSMFSRDVFDFFLARIHRRTRMDGVRTAEGGG